ncbi:uncharacterized protein LOC106168135 isoform X1 [Lingula anatina]|uniref:Uncharacterized protein LOC106168135 isoform X1 n=1 Tax=Lingula anatina TaxID=7574 RepID=A0A1S3IX45_LINAN|nr:uncharacterized protein LOC106168135 isoform X1 [Lingula anatina]|eukprot:XP_013402541.1 uncharacterized protein LOC106168135 isoform X1 [Lingula anatina]
MNQTPQRVPFPVFFTQPPPAYFAERYHHKAGVSLGVAQLVFGVNCFILGIVYVAWPPAAFLSLTNRASGAGIWCGILFIVTGVLGILTKNRDKRLIIAYMIMSIISVVFAWTALISVSAVDVTASAIGNQVSLSNGFITFGSLINFGYISVGLSGYMVFLSVVEGIIAIIASAFCCHGVCCGAQPSTPGTVAYAEPNIGQNAMAYVAPAQQVPNVHYPGVGGYYPQHQQWPQGGATGQMDEHMPQKL